MPVTVHVKPIKGLGEALKAHAQAAQDKIELVLEKVGEVMVPYLEALGEQEQGWKNITGTLERGYAYQVDGIEGGARLVLRNDVWYASVLEAKRGYMVLTGVTDPGGPVEQKLIEVCAEFAPEWVVIRG